MDVLDRVANVHLDRAHVHLGAAAVHLLTINVDSRAGLVPHRATIVLIGRTDVVDRRVVVRIYVMNADVRR